MTEERFPKSQGNTTNTVETYDKKSYDKKSRPSISKKIARERKTIAEQPKNVEEAKIAISYRMSPPLFIRD